MTDYERGYEQGKFDAIKAQELTGFMDSKLNPIKRQWVGLTYQEIVEIMGSRDWTTCWSDVTYTRAVEAKLKEKNGG